MSKTRDTGNITNVIKVDATGNVSFVSGSTTLATISTSGQMSGSLPALSSSYALSASYVTNAETLDGLDSTVFTLTSSFNTTSASLYTVSSSAYATSGSLSATSGSLSATSGSLSATSGSLSATSGSLSAASGSLSAASGSFNTRVTALEITGSALSSSILSVSASSYSTSGSLSSASGSFDTRISTVESKYATTGSNTFIGTQIISGSILQSGSFTSTGTLTAQTLVVQTITSSVVYSSGSNIFGNSLGNSQVFTGSVLITGSLTIAGASSATSYSGTTIYGSTAVCSPVGKFTTCLDLGGALTGTSATFTCAMNADSYGMAGATQAMTWTTNTLRLGQGTYWQNIELWANGSSKLTIASTGAATFACQVNADSFYTNDTRYVSNQIMAGYNTNSEDSDIWINYTGYLGGTTRFRDFRVGNGKQGQIAFFDGSTGNVGIGSTSPAELLEVSGSLKIGNLKIQNSNGGRIGFNRNTLNGAIYNCCYAAFQINGAYANSDYLDFQNYNSSGSYIGGFVLNNGNVGICTSSPATLLANTSTRPANADGLSIHLYGLDWAVNGQGYAGTIWNTSATANNYNAGLLVRICSTDATDKILDLESGGVNRFRMLGTGAATFNGNVTITNNNWLNFTDSTATARNILTLAGNDNLYLQYKAGCNFYLRNTDGDLRLTIASTGIACFACTVCAPTFAGSTVRSTSNLDLNANSGYLTLRTGDTTRLFVGSTGGVSVGAVTDPGLYNFIVAGTVSVNGVITKSIGGTITSNTSTYFDFPTWDDAGQGQMLEVKAFFDHYYNFDYGTHLYRFVISRDTSTCNLTIFNCTSVNGGSWVVYKTSSTNLRVCKIGGTYGGGGAYWIQVTGKQP